ncbi:MAG: OsmC family protein [Solimonas sp.]
MTPISTASARIGALAYRTDLSTGRHALVADEPAHAGGQDAGPAPYDYLLSALGACTAITLRMYAGKKGWELGELRVDLTLLKNREGETRIERVLHCSAPLSNEQWERLLDIAGKTPVTKTLLQGAPIATQRGA